MKTIKLLSLILLSTFALGFYACENPGQVEEKEKVSLELISSAGGEVSGSGTYEKGSEVEIEALPSAGYAFAGWKTESGELLTTSPSYTITLQKDTELTATFTTKKWSVQLAATGSGEGQVKGSGVYALGATVKAEAIANENSIFKHWANREGEIVSTNASYEFVPENDVTLYANFEIVTFYIDADAANEYAGMITGAGEYERGSEVVLYPQPSEGYAFSHWVDASGKTLSTMARYSFKATCDRYIRCVFVVRKHRVVFKRNFQLGKTPAVELKVNNSSRKMEWNKEYVFTHNDLISLTTPAKITNYQGNGFSSRITADGKYCYETRAINNAVYALFFETDY